MGLLHVDVPNLPAELERLLTQIPPGHVTTYGDLARALGDIVAARWIGEYLLDHLHTDVCGCHRVVRKNGDVGLYITGDPREKIARLISEGVDVSEGRATLDSKLFTEFIGPAPLQTLRDLQQQLPGRVQLCPIDHRVRTVAGIDVSYITAHDAVAAYVKIDAATHELLWSTTVRGLVKFPYIPGYLSFRELPLFVKLFEQVRNEQQEADLTLVDGNGLLHPRRAGSASAVGVVVDAPTVGIGKKLLCGHVDLERLVAGRPREVVHQDEVIGLAMRSGESKRPFFASPGHRITLEETLTLVQQTLGKGRLPLPIALADRISRAEARRIKSSVDPQQQPAAPGSA